jgi:hypothetical protein
MILIYYLGKKILGSDLVRFGPVWSDLLGTGAKVARPWAAKRGHQDG